MKRLFLALFVSLFALPAGAEQWLLHNGRIATLDSAATMAEAILIDGDTIAAVGDELSLRAQADRQVRVVDLRGRLVIPGLIDSHIHAIRAGLTFAQEVNWTDVPSLEEALARMTDVAARRPADAWIVVPGGWNAQQFREKRLPTQAEVEMAAGGSPVYVHMSFAGVLLSQRGFALLGLAQESDLPSDARFERDPHGHLRLGEIAFGRMVKDHLAAKLEELGISLTIIDKDLGYELRCADPIPFDAEYTRDLGYGAVKFLKSDECTKYGAVISFIGGKLQPIPFENIINPTTRRMKTRIVDVKSEGFECARRYMIMLDKSDIQDPIKLDALAKSLNWTSEQFKKRFSYLVGL
jgi:hypothetical protein